VHFKPGGAFPFLGAPAGDFHNRRVPLHALWGNRAHELFVALLAAKTVRARFKILEDALLVESADARPPHDAVTTALETFQAGPPLPTITEVLDQVGLSRRRFIEVFTAHVGLTPKVFTRLLRFHKARQFSEQVERPVWANIALACGYYDQAHLISDFRKFSGHTPAAYELQRGESSRQVPVATFPLTG
jgi:transcriptional regulator GlxA family with amidase domain